MLMNSIEFWLMNNPIRSFIQTFEAKALRKKSNLAPGKKVLEIGCGQGTGTRLITRYFRPREIFSVDLDSKMIERARKRVKAPFIHFQVADASRLPFPDHSFDAVFDFGIIHHIPNWQDCIFELYRVLKPGGVLLLEDLSIESFESHVLGRLLKHVLDHPYAQMYRRKDFMRELENAGFKIGRHYENWFWFQLAAVKPI